MNNPKPHSFQSLVTGAIATVALLAIMPTVAQAQEYRFLTLKHPDAATDKDTVIIDVRSGKAIIGTYTDAKNVQHGYLYNRDTGTFTTFDHPNAGTAPGQGTYLDAINNVGGKTGTYTDNNGRKYAFVYDSNSRKSTTYQLSKYEVSGHLFFNDNGVVAGHCTDKNDAHHGFLFDSVTQTVTLLDHPQATTKRRKEESPVHYDPGTYISGINNEGMVIGHYTDKNHLIRGFIYNCAKRTYVEIVPPYASPGITVGTQPTGITDKGMVVGSYQDRLGREVGFLYNSATGEVTTPRTRQRGVRGTVLYNNATSKLTTFGVLTSGDPAYNHTEPAGINSKGMVVGLTFNPTNDKNDGLEFHGFLYDTVTAKSAILDYPDTQFKTVLTAINDDGVVFGYYIKHLGKGEVDFVDFVALPTLTRSPANAP